MVLNPHMIRESYKNKYVSVIKVREKTGGIYYHNPESLYEFFIEKNKIIEEYLTKNHPEVVIVNYYPYLESLTSKYDNLFIDEYHMTSLGNKVVAEFVARKIDEIIFRKESKNDTRI